MRRDIKSSTLSIRETFTHPDVVINRPQLRVSNSTCAALSESEWDWCQSRIKFGWSKMFLNMCWLHRHSKRSEKRNSLDPSWICSSRCSDHRPDSRQSGAQKKQRQGVSACGGSLQGPSQLWKPLGSHNSQNRNLAGKKPAEFSVQVRSKSIQFDGDHQVTAENRSKSGWRDVKFGRRGRNIGIDSLPMKWQREIYPLLKRKLKTANWSTHTCDMDE